MSKTLGQLQHDLKQLEVELNELKQTMELPDYVGDYHFDFKPTLTSADFTHVDLQAMVEACNNTSVHMHPDLVSQLIETEMFERMKGVVKRHIDGKSIMTLMSIKNDLERKMINDLIEARANKLNAFNKELADVELALSAEEHPVDIMVKTFDPNKTVKRKK